MRARGIGGALSESSVALDEATTDHRINRRNLFARDPWLQAGRYRQHSVFSRRAANTRPR